MASTNQTGPGSALDRRAQRLDPLAGRPWRRSIWRRIAPPFQLFRNPQRAARHSCRGSASWRVSVAVPNNPSDQRVTPQRRRVPWGYMHTVHPVESKKRVTVPNNPHNDCRVFEGPETALFLARGGLRCTQAMRRLTRRPVPTMHSDGGGPGGWGWTVLPC